MMIRSWGAIACTAALMAGAFAAHAQTERRVALVIGNGAYKTGSLKNPINDARDVAGVLRRIGFTVTHLENVDRAQMQNGVSDFSNLLRPDEVGLFYFAGAAVQVDGKSYLMPLGHEIRRSLTSTTKHWMPSQSFVSWRLLKIRSTSSSSTPNALIHLAV